MPNKACWFLFTLMSGLVAAFIYKFILTGTVVPASDGRMAILLTSGERDLVLAEMRGFLQSIQIITEAVANEDLPSITKGARRVGLAAQQEVPASLVGKLPLAFKTLGFDTHSRFDQIALNTEQLGDSALTLPALAGVLNNCVACHASYRFEVVAESPRP